MQTLKSPTQRRRPHDARGPGTSGFFSASGTPHSQSNADETKQNPARKHEVWGRGEHTNTIVTSATQLQNQNAQLRCRGDRGRVGEGGRQKNTRAGPRKSMRPGLGERSTNIMCGRRGPRVLSGGKGGYCTRATLLQLYQKLRNWQL